MQRNRLAAETSPYLLQHADNPVDWYPWGEQALLAAKEHNKPILLSIGYSACHWCVDESVVRQHQGGSRRASGLGQDLPGGAAADHPWLRRLAADHVPDP